jgi:CBS domain-containing protein
MLGQLLGATLVALVVAKAVVWAVALGSGTSGGVLAPLLMIGGGIGALFGAATGTGDPGLWAMVGMAGMMGGTMRSPLTGAIFVLELTHDLNALPALLVGSAAALCVTVLVLKRSILTEKLSRRGQHIACEYTVDPFAFIRVSEVMECRPPVVDTATTVATLSERIGRGQSAVAERQATVIIDSEGGLAGIITRGDLVHALLAGSGEKTVLQAGSRNAAHAFPDETLQSAIGTMLRRDVGRLPVVDRSSARKVVGYLGRAEILAARTRMHEQEELREKRPLPFTGRSKRRDAPVSPP